MKKKSFVIKVSNSITMMGTSIMLFILPAFAQPIKIGDDLSGLVLHQVQNYGADSLRIADHSGKLIILDFWNVSCGPCIAYMPTMEALQEKFKDKLQVILVTSDDVERVKKASEKNENIRSIRLPSVIGDSTLQDRLPFRSLPSHVWLDQKGIVRYIAAGPYATEENIQAFLNGKDIMLPLKSEIKDFDFSKPLWLEGNGRHLPKLQFYSYLVDRINISQGLLGIKKDRETGVVNHIRAINTAIIMLTKVAYGEGNGGADNPFWYDNRVILDVKDPEPFVWPEPALESTLWLEKYSYCYELKVPVSKAGQLYPIMRRDLDTYLGVKAEIVELEKDVYELVLKDSTRLRGDGESRPGAFNTRHNSETIRHFTNMPLKNLIEEIMADYHTDLILVSSLPALKSVSLDWKLGTTDVDDLKTRLREIGIDLVKKRKKIPMLRIYD